MMESRYLHTVDIHNEAAAQTLVNYLYQLFTPNSVLDVGCGTGNFLKAFQQNGVKDIQGVDGNWLNPAELFINEVHFKSVDLEQPLYLGRRFDLLLCLEVAEHLAPAAAATLVHSLATHSDLIVFSAAIPGQGGQNHINEQPHEYWCSLFEQEGYYFYDIIRPQIWQDTTIPAWYRQNIFLAVHQANPLPQQQGWKKITAAELHTMVHPDILQNCRTEVFAWQQKALQAESDYNSLLRGRYRWSTYRKILADKLLKRSQP